MYGRRTPPSAYVPCDTCGKYLKMKNDGGLFSHKRAMTKEELETHKRLISTGTRSYYRGHVQCNGKAAAYACPACDGSGLVPLLGEYTDDPIR
jgi:hypothetical protein